MPSITISNTDTITNDTISVRLYANYGYYFDEFNDPNLGKDKDSDKTFVSITMKKDFFTPADGCTVVIETDSPSKYVSYMQRGARIDVYLNGNINLQAFIFDIKFEYSRTHTKLILECKDLLEFMAQGSIPPNANVIGQLTSFHIPANYSLKQCLELIIKIYEIGLHYIDDGSIPKSLNIVYGDNNPTAGINVGPLSIASGGGVGIRVAGKSSKNYTKSVNKAIGRFNQPHKGESYLDFMKRMVKVFGGNIKMAPGSLDTIVVQSPTYDRNTSPFYNITHYLSGDNSSQNNVLDANLHFAFDKIHNVIIVEGNSLDENEWHLTDAKSIALNELSALSLVDLENINTAIKPSVAVFVYELTGQDVTKSQTNPIGTTNYKYTPFNTKLYQQRFNIGIDINSSMCQPRYEVSTSAKNLEQLQFEAAVLMAEEQDKALEFKYKLQGWSQIGPDGKPVIWQPNQLVNVIEESLSPGNPLKLTLWIKEVTYYKDRHNGTYVEVVCTLPYTHNFELSDVPANVNPPSSETHYVPTTELIVKSIQALQSQVSNQNNMFHEGPAPGIETPARPWYNTTFIR